MGIQPKLAVLYKQKHIMVCEANSKKFSEYLNYSKINFFISWTMFMWFCTSPGQNYMYFKSGSTDGDSKTLAVFAIITSIFGWFYFFWNMHQVRPDTVSMVLAFAYSISMLVCAIMQEIIKGNSPSGTTFSWQFTLIWGAWVNSFIPIGSHVLAWLANGRKTCVWGNAC